MGDIRYAKEPFSHELVREIAPLLAEHWAEIAHYRDIQLDPDWAAYEKMHSVGALRIFTARDDGKLIGYCIYFVRHNVHYKGSLQANQDVLFLSPDHRGKTVGYRLIKFCDESLRGEGVQAVYQHVKVAHDFGPMLERMGYVFVDKIYARRLD